MCSEAHFTSVVFLPQILNSSLFLRKTLDKFQLVMSEKITNDPQNSQGHQKQGESVTAESRLRRHNGKMYCGIVDGILEEKQDIG